MTGKENLTLTQDDFSDDVASHAKFCPGRFLSPLGEAAEVAAESAFRRGYEDGFQAAIAIIARLESETSAPSRQQEIAMVRDLIRKWRKRRHHGAVELPPK